ncbi:Uncharacterised protein [uncultured archaeon]|nr:Uncharacterised protein [uncultured archaeon]
MEEKTIVLVVLLAVVAIGLVGLVNLNSQSGATVIERNCMCSITMYGNYGDALGTQTQLVRVRSAESWTDAACQNLCDQYYGRSSEYSRTAVVGTAV